MAMIHVSRSGASLGVFDEARVREGLGTGEFIETDLGWMEGMPTWRPLSELASFGAQAAPPPPPPPSATTPPVQESVPPSAVIPAPAPVGLPWETRRDAGFFNALFDTIVMVLTRPSEAFTVMKREGGLADPVLYAVILGTVGGIVSLGFSSAFQALGFLGRDDYTMGALLGMGAGSIAVLLFMPVMLLIGLFVGSAIIHVCLMITGGANRSFETTLRVLSYGGGSANVFQLIPICGGMIAAVWSIVLNCIGLARAHETDTWRAVVAVLLPMIICCGAGVFLIMALIGALAGADFK